MAHLTPFRKDCHNYHRKYSHNCPQKHLHGTGSVPEPVIKGRSGTAVFNYTFFQKSSSYYFILYLNLYSTYSSF